MQGASHICPEDCEAQWWKLWKIEVVDNTEDMAVGATGALSSAVKVGSGNVDYSKVELQLNSEIGDQILNQNQI